MDAKEYSELLMSYGNRYVRDGLQAWERHLQSLNRTAGDQVNLEEAQKRFTEFARKDGADTVRKVMQINYDFYNSLLDTYLEFSKNALNASLRAAGNRPASAAAARAEAVSAASATSSRNIDLDFTAKKGAAQKQAFVVANKNGARIDVSFEISELICEDGKTKVKAPVVFEPDHFELQAGEEQIVECRLKLTRALKAGLQYVALARVVGFDGLFVRLIVSPE